MASATFAQRSLATARRMGVASIVPPSCTPVATLRTAATEPVTSYPSAAAPSADPYEGPQRIPATPWVKFKQSTLCLSLCM